MFLYVIRMIEVSINTAETHNTGASISWLTNVAGRVCLLKIDPPLSNFYHVPVPLNV